MRRLGLFSGTVYSSEDFENDKIKECAVQIPEKMKDSELKDFHKPHLRTKFSSRIERQPRKPTIRRLVYFADSNFGLA